MRIFGRNAASVWSEIDTDPNGFNDDVYLTALIQAIKLNPGESPFYANIGIPSQQSVIQQLLPDFYVAQIQQLYAGYFVSLVIGRISSSPPIYQASIIGHTGASFVVNIQVPQ